MNCFLSRRPLLPVGLFLPLLLLGCGRTDRGDWDLQKGALTLTETLHRAEGEMYYFGVIYDIAVREDGYMYVADGKAGHIKVLTPSGTLARTIGRSGEGPGEFRRPAEVDLTEDDSLYVMDAWGRASVFGPDGNFAYAFRVRSEGGAPRQMMVRQEGGGCFFVYLPLPKSVVEGTPKAAIRPVGSGGTIGDTLYTARPYQRISTEYSVPFGRMSYFAQGPAGHIHHAWNDSLRVSSLDSTGRVQRTVAIPFTPVPVTAETRETVLEDRSGEARAFAKAHLPEKKPAFTDFLVDDEGRYWFGRPMANPDSTEWWLVWPEKQRVETTTLPSEVDLEVVQNGNAYGTTSTEAGAPALVRYRIQQED